MHNVPLVLCLLRVELDAVECLLLEAALEVLVHVLEVILAARLRLHEALGVRQLALQALDELPVAPVLALEERHAVHLALPSSRERDEAPGPIRLKRLQVPRTRAKEFPQLPAAAAPDSCASIADRTRALVGDWSASYKQ